MSDSESERNEILNGLTLRRAFFGHWRYVVFAAALVAITVGGLGLVYLTWVQPERRVSFLEFRPTFDGLNDAKYPNGLPFSSDDIIAPSVLDAAFDVNNVQEFCSRDVFRGGFYVEQRSDAMTVLDAEYSARLAESRLTAVDRARLQEEYVAKRQALPVQFRLAFIRPQACAEMPRAVVEKILADILSTWANESELRRGVLNQRLQVLTPAMLDMGLEAESSRLVQADLVRTALWRIIDNIARVEILPGASLVRLGKERTTFQEVRSKLIDLTRSRLEPLVAQTGQSSARESASWAAEMFASAERERLAASQRAEAFRRALQDYSGLPSAPSPRSAQGTTGGDVQTLAPQIDRTFIDRLIEMSESNTMFRRTLTDQLVTASVEEVAAAQRAAYYQRLHQLHREPSRVNITAAQIDERLGEIVRQGKALTQQFNDVYDEFSRVSFRPAGGLYQIEKPATSELSREFTLSRLVVVTLGAAATALLLGFGVAIVREIFPRA